MKALKTNWKIYSMEAICLGLFMVSASLFGTMLGSPASPVHQWITNATLRDVVMGILMGVTATLLIYSPMGRLSGAHMNPAVTFTFLGLRKIKMEDALGYVVFQTIGGVLAVYAMAFILGSAFTQQPVDYVVTVPGKYGAIGAFMVEVTIAFCMMTMVLITTNHKTMARYTGVISGVFVASYVVLSGPISGFGMNPARTLASAIPADRYTALWVYLTAPFLGMFAAAAIYKLFHGKVLCAKFHHHEKYQCIFDCGYCKHQPQEAEGKN